MKSVIAKYLRISSEDINLDGIDKYESNSITNQRAYLDDFILSIPEFLDYEIMEVVDDGRSGTNFNRPGITELLNLAERGKVQCIVVKDLSRFGRNFLEAGDYLEQKFPAWGVRFISVNDMYDSAKLNGATGGIDLAFRNLIYEMYSQDLSGKVRSARAIINKNGKSTASYAFFGYNKDPNDRHKFIVDEKAANIVRLIFTLREQGLSCQKIAQKLNLDNIKTANEIKRENGAKRNWTRNGKAEIWVPSYIRNILNDERYTGKHIYGKNMRVELGKPACKPMPKADWIVIPDTLPVIISDEQFKRVHDIMSSAITNKKFTPQNEHRQEADRPLFSRRLFCGGCGLSLQRIPSKGGHAYRCSTSQIAAGMDCMQGSLKESDIKVTVLAALQQQVILACGAKSVQRAHNKTSSVTIDNLRGEIRNLQKLLDKSRSVKMSLWEKYHTGSISREVYQSESEKLNEQTALYESKSLELSTQAQKLESEVGIEDTFIERLSEQAGIQELTKAVVAEFIKAIYIHAPNRIEIVFNYSDLYAKNLVSMGSDK